MSSASMIEPNFQTPPPVKIIELHEKTDKICWIPTKHFYSKANHHHKDMVWQVQYSELSYFKTKGRRPRSFSFVLVLEAFLELFDFSGQEALLSLGTFANFIHTNLVSFGQLGAINTGADLVQQIKDGTELVRQPLIRRPPLRRLVHFVPHVSFCFDLPGHNGRSSSSHRMVSILDDILLGKIPMTMAESADLIDVGEV